MVRELIGADVELAVCQGAFTVGDGDGVGCTIRLLFEQAVDRAVGEIGAAVRFHVTRSFWRSTGRSNGISDKRRSGSATAAFRRVSKCAIMRATVARSNRSVL